MNKRFYLYMVDAVVFALCAGFWLSDGLLGAGQVGWGNVVMGLLWLAGAVFWITRAMKAYQQSKGRKS